MAAVLLTIATAWAALTAGVVFGFLRAARNAPVAPPTADELDLADLLLARPIAEWDEWAAALAWIDSLPSTEGTTR